MIQVSLGPEAGKLRDYRETSDQHSPVARGRRVIAFSTVPSSRLDGSAFAALRND